MKPLRILSLSFFVFAFSFAQAGDWPQWRGLHRDGLIAGEAPLEGLKKGAVAWKVPVGKGQGGLVLADGKLLMLHETEVGGKLMETAALLNAATGKPIWQTPYAESWQYRNIYGPGPRVAPQIDGDLVFVQGVTGTLACLTLKDGKLQWSVNYPKDFGAKWFGGNAPGSGGTAASRHGNNGPPVTDEKHIYAPAGGHNGASIVCLNKRTGKMVWKSGSDYAAYSGLMLAKLGGEQQVVMLTAANLAGYRSSDGKQLWSVPAVSGAARNIVTPIINGDTVTVASHTFGTFQVRIRKSGDGQVAEELWRNKDVRTNITSPVLIEGHLYGLGTTRGKNSDFVCINHKTGRVVWEKKSVFPDYVSVIANGKQLLVHGSNGNLWLLAASPKGYSELGQIKASQTSWNHPVYSNGILYVKDGKRDGDNMLTALKLR